MAAAALLAAALVAATLPGPASAYEITSCFYPNKECEGEEGEFGVKCTHTEANSCPDEESERALHIGECKSMSTGGSRMVSCPGPVWCAAPRALSSVACHAMVLMIIPLRHRPKLLIVLLFLIAIIIGWVYWKKQQAGARLEAYMDSLPWYAAAKPAITKAEIVVGHAVSFQSTARDASLEPFAASSVFFGSFSGRVRVAGGRGGPRGGEGGALCKYRHNPPVAQVVCRAFLTDCL